MLTEKKSLEAPGGALIALNCPDEPQLGPADPFKRGQDLYSCLVYAGGMLFCSPPALACMFWGFS